MKHVYLRHRTNTRPANVLVGCLVAIAIVVILAIIAAIYVGMTWRGHFASFTKQGAIATLESAQIEQAEQDEIMVHIDTLMTRFENKEVTFEQLGEVIDGLTKSSVPAAAMVITLDRYYIANSELDEAEKSQGRIELARYTQGLFETSIKQSSVNDVLDPIITTTPDSNDIKLNFSMGNDGAEITALRSADEVTDDELRTVIASAKAKADEAGISETPTPIDLSDEIGTAMANALGEDPSDWIGDVNLVEDEAENTDDLTLPPAEPAADPSADPADPDGP